MFSYTKGTYALVARLMLAEGLLEEEHSIHSKKCRADPQERRYRNISVFKRSRVFVH